MIVVVALWFIQGLNRVKKDVDKPARGYAEIYVEIVI